MATETASVTDGLVFGDRTLASPMILTMATTGSTEEQRTVRIPFASTSLNINIYWGDGNSTLGRTTADPEHVYASEGTYTIQVTGAARTLGNATVSTRWSTKLRSIVQWGTLGLTSLANGFRGYTGASLPLPSDLPSGVTTLTLTFYQAANLTSLPDLATWDTTNVTTMSSTFNGCSGMTSPPPVGSWSTANVTNMLSMFAFCSGMTSPPPVGSWSTANVTNMDSLFRGCSGMTSPPDVSGWDTAKVTSVHYIFGGCSGMTSPPDVSGWDTAKVQDMRLAFYLLGSRDIPADDWSIAGVTVPNSFDSMFLLTTLPTARYDALLTKWEAQAVKPVGATFHGGSSKYSAGSAAQTARTSLANPATNNWTIVDGGRAKATDSATDGAVFGDTVVQKTSVAATDGMVFGDAADTVLPVAVSDGIVWDDEPTATFTGTMTESVSDCLVLGDTPTMIFDAHPSDAMIWGELIVADSYAPAAAAYIGKYASEHASALAMVSEAGR